MTHIQTALRVAAMTAAALMLLTIGVVFEAPVDAQSQSQGATLTGTWFLTTPDGLTGVCNYDQGGTTNCVRSHEAGGSPRPGAFRSALVGSWRRVGGHFEVVRFSFAYDGVTGEQKSITRVEETTSFGEDINKLTGEFLVTMWLCPTPPPAPDPTPACPDPTTAAPDVGPFYGGTFTMTRVQLP